MTEVSSTRLYLGNLPKNGEFWLDSQPSTAQQGVVVDATVGIECRTNSISKATKADVEAHFATHGTGEITEVKLMNGFGFIEYKDPMDARDVVPGKALQSHEGRFP
jgi:RNA recognition motif-containing protein